MDIPNGFQAQTVEEEELPTIRGGGKNKWDWLVDLVDEAYQEWKGGNKKGLVINAPSQKLATKGKWAIDRRHRKQSRWADVQVKVSARKNADPASKEAHPYIIIVKFLPLD